MLELNKVYCMDCLEGIKQLDNQSIDSVITDPPYELGFMNKSWDNSGIAYNVDFWKEVYRVLKPGGHVASFGGTRTYHRMTCAIEDAGFEIRDQLQWLYGSGFPKSRNLSKDMDIDIPAAPGRKAVSKRERIERDNDPLSQWHVQNGLRKDQHSLHDIEDGTFTVTSNEAVTEDAQKWEGWGTALKPANEPIVLARKPISERTVALNVLQWDTGGINIDDCRVDLNGEKNPTGSAKRVYKSNQYTEEKIYGDNKETPDNGRFPANLLLSHSIDCTEGNCSQDCPIKTLNEQSGITKSGKVKNNKDAYGGKSNTGFLRGVSNQNNQHGDSGGASRFFNHCDWDINDLQASFMYCVKASKKERGEKNNHPTVKPKALMKWLITLLTPENGIVLDPFAGSGTTGVAAKELGFDCILIEKEKEYIPIIEYRTGFNIFIQ